MSTDTTVRRLPDTVYIARGFHAPGDPTTGDPACTMEWAAWLAGEPWGDDPACTHPVISAAVRAVNDRLGDGPRQQLAELIPALVGTADTRDDPLARRQLSVRLAAWCAEQVLHLVPDVAREACERAIAAARAWADDPCDRTREAARIYSAAADDAAIHTAYAAACCRSPSHMPPAVFAAAAAAAAAIYAADHMAAAAIYAADAIHPADGDPIGLLRGLLAEHTRLRQEVST